MNRFVAAVRLALALAVVSCSTKTTSLPPGDAAVSAEKDTTPWWQNAVIYEIYPRSFQDSNNDGVGDLPGIISRLDYLRDLGVDAIWLTPIYPSPNVDFGYDVADYLSIDPMYGSLHDFDELVLEAKKRKIHVLMDMVLNHTSDKHPWFVDSSSSRTSPKRDWYVWNDGQTKDGHGVPRQTRPTSGAAATNVPQARAQRVPPNNWQSIFGHSAWQFSPATDAFYYHFFYAQQPDLNWRNPAVQQAMFDAVKFWLGRGADGFRLDAIDTLFEKQGLPNAAEGPGVNAFGDPTPNFEYQSRQPEVHDVLRDLRKVVDSYRGHKLLIGEIYTKDTAELRGWYGEHDAELHLPMDLHLVGVKTFDTKAFRERLSSAQTQLDGHTPLLVSDNHDQPRSLDRWGKDTVYATAAIVLGTRGSSLLYYGQEIGMQTSTPKRKEDVKDPIGITGWPNEKGRDGERTPMQWDLTVSSGFTGAVPWLPIGPDANYVNVAQERGDPDSLFNWYRRLLELRRTSLVFRDGATRFFDHDHDNALVWVRTLPGKSSLLVVVNMSNATTDLSVEADMTALGIGAVPWRPVASANHGESLSWGKVHLPPYAVYIGEIQQ